MSISCELDDEEFKCCRCGRMFDVTQGSWPRVDWDGNMRPDLAGDRDVEAFECYDCMGPVGIDPEPDPNAYIYNSRYWN